MAKSDAEPNTAADLDALRTELAAERAKREELSAQFSDALSIIGELKDELAERRRLDAQRHPTMRDRIEDARRAQQISSDLIAKQSIGRNEGEFGWRIAIRGHKQPLTMWCDKSDMLGAIAVFNNRYGTQFNQKTMTISPISQPVARTAENTLVKKIGQSPVSAS